MVSTRLVVAVVICFCTAMAAGAHPADGDDALKNAGEHHKLLLENEHVRVLETKIRPGETTAVHVHPWPATLYVVSFSDYIRYDEKGAVLLDSRTLTKKPKAGEALWSGPVARHSIKNVGDADLTVIAVELKQSKK